MSETEDMDVYGKGEAEAMEENDEITELEEGFIKGYNEGESMAKCAKCKKVLGEEIVEEEIDGNSYRFCSSDCATAFEESQ
tara:strand:+ start:916 stop:1158 length:243 start_codon:yes stop_codon:yes gene_type:complete